MPSVPIEMPSETPIVLKRMPTRPAASTPCFTSAERSSRCMLQGLPSNQQEAIPTCALSRSASERPVAKSIACEAPCERGFVIRSLVRLSLAMASLPRLRDQAHDLGARASHPREHGVGPAVLRAERLAHALAHRLVLDELDPQGVRGPLDLEDELAVAHR